MRDQVYDIRGRPMHPLQVDSEAPLNTVLVMKNLFLKNAQ